MAKRRRFYVEGCVKVQVGLEITAASLEDAQERAKEFDLADFVDIKGDHHDSRYALTGVFALDAMESV